MKHTALHGVTIPLLSDVNILCMVVAKEMTTDLQLRLNVKQSALNEVNIKEGKREREEKKKKQRMTTSKIKSICVKIDCAVENN